MEPKSSYWGWGTVLGGSSLVGLDLQLPVCPRVGTDKARTRSSIMGDFKEPATGIVANGRNWTRCLRIEIG